MIVSIELARVPMSAAVVGIHRGLGLAGAPAWASLLLEIAAAARWLR